MYVRGLKSANLLKFQVFLNFHGTSIPLATSGSGRLNIRCVPWGILSLQDYYIRGIKAVFYELFSIAEVF